ncbi:hypothetical protein Lpp17_2767 [Lacticaseibacillus paracasei subsp. paracasei Lpp17]|nr:hypothetical protein Lpp17_2767 [Lacticaseibacillus paracasei subsp. paracasei Lpp17]
MNTVSDNMVKGFKGYRKKPNYAKKISTFFWFSLSKMAK